MSKRLLQVAGGVILSLATVGLAVAQDTQTTTTTQTTVKQVTQNPDGTYTIIEYPVGKEVTVDLTPTGTINGATGRATVLRTANGSTIKLNMTGLPADMNNFNAYAVDPAGHTTLLGPVTISNGVATQTFTSPLNKFMLVLSPEANLSSYGPDTNVIFRSAVPTGMAVIPVETHNSGGSTPSAVGDRVTATTTASATPAYNVPTLGIPSFKLGKQTHMRINFTGELAGSRANALILPRQDGPVQIKVRFHDLKRSNTPDTRIVLWAISPDKQFVKIGQIVNTGRRNETEIKGETALKDFGLFFTAEPADVATPNAPIVGTISQ